MLNLGYDARIEFKPLKKIFKFKTWNSGHLCLLNYMLILRNATCFNLAKLPPLKPGTCVLDPCIKNRFYTDQKIH